MYYQADLVDQLHTRLTVRMWCLIILLLYEQIQHVQHIETFPCDEDASASFCNCKKMDPFGGEFYSCQGSDITEIPTELAVTVASLTIFWANISRLKNDDFSNHIKLRDIILNFNGITELSSDVFKYNVNLVHLYLSGNYIETLPEDLFVHNLQLAQLALDGNKIKSFDLNMLTKNTALYLIHISDNPIVSLSLKGNISTLLELSCHNCFDCACMDSSTWGWIKQKYDNFDFGCRDGQDINSDLIAVYCLNNSHVTLYRKDTEKVRLACQCFDVTSSRTEVNTSLTENQSYEQAVTLQTRTANTKSNDQISSPLEGSSLAILSGMVGFILGSSTTAAIVLLVKRKHNEKVHQERILRHEETNTLVLDSINIIQSLDIEDIEVYGEPLGHISLNIPPRNHNEDMEIYGEPLGHISLNIPPRNHTEDIDGETLSQISFNIPPRNHEILLTDEGIDCFTLCSTVERI